jgi:hypothetical protein
MIEGAKEITSWQEAPVIFNKTELLLLLQQSDESKKSPLTVSFISSRVD